jgi:hypothetical protein
MFYLVSLSICNKKKQQQTFVRFFFLSFSPCSPAVNTSTSPLAPAYTISLQAPILAQLDQFKYPCIYNQALLFFLSVSSSSLPGITQASGPTRKLAQSLQLVETRHHIAITGAHGPADETKKVSEHRKTGRLQLNSKREVLGQFPNQGSSNISRG